ncbi:MAG: hypothetical protein ACXWVH_02310, partial [Caulobacteraceae bacterium]
MSAHDDHFEPPSPSHHGHDHEHGHEHAAPTPNPPMVGRLDPDLTRLFTSLDFQSLDASVQDALSQRINLYYDQPLEIFPYGERNTKPDRFHVLFVKQIEERFPDDAKMRGENATYGRFMFRSLLAYMLGKRLMQGATLAALGAMAVFGPG